MVENASSENHLPKVFSFARGSITASDFRYFLFDPTDYLHLAIKPAHSVYGCYSSADWLRVLDIILGRTEYP